MSALSYLSPKAQVRPSAIHGRGLFAREAIAKEKADNQKNLEKLCAETPSMCGK